MFNDDIYVPLSPSVSYFTARVDGLSARPKKKTDNIASESIATLPPFSSIEGHKWFDQISSQWVSQYNRFALISFGKIQFLPPCIWNLPFMSYRLRLTNTRQLAKPNQSDLLFRGFPTWTAWEYMATRAWSKDWHWGSRLKFFSLLTTTRQPNLPNQTKHEVTILRSLV